MSRYGLRWLNATLGLGCMALVLGCGGAAKVREAAARTRRVNQLKGVGLAYHNYWDANGKKAPRGVSDLQPYLQSFPDALQAVQSGDIIVCWGARYSEDFPQGLLRTVLAYDKDVPTQGGPVLLGDASARIMTAQEFQAAPRPKNSKQQGGRDLP